MTRTIMILDAYNILHRVRHWKPLLDTSLESAREALLGYCRRWMLHRGDVWLFVVVFDGQSSVVGGASTAGPGIRVVYSPTEQTADDCILDIIDEFGPDYHYVVVSDDRYVRKQGRSMSAKVMTSQAFSQVLSKSETPSDRGTAKKRQTRSRLDAVPDDTLSPAQAADITNELKRLWGN